jgi:hypothetical protein
MSRGPWRPNPKEVLRLIELAKEQGLTVTSIETTKNGTIRIETKPPSESTQVETSEDLKNLILRQPHR